MSKFLKHLILRRSLASSSISSCVHGTVFIKSLSRSLSFSLRHVNQLNVRYLHQGNTLNEQSALKSQTQDEQNVSETDQSDDLDSKISKYAELAVDVDTKKKILMILMEHEVAKLEGKRVPVKLSIMDMQELLTLYSFSSRVKYMGYLFARETAKATEKRKKEVRKKEYAAWLIEKEKLQEIPPQHIEYGIGKNTLLVRVRRKSVMRYCNQRLANAVLDGQKFIIDMDFDCFMRKQDCSNCGEQLLEMYGSNRRNRYPYDLFFCNVQHSSATMRAFAKYMPNIYAPDNFITLSDLNYLDLFPKEKLVYITPHAKEPLHHYDYNAIYIIGGLVDKCVREPVVMAKAKREGIRAVYLPYDEYLMWGRGSKSLPLNHIMEIMLEMKRTNDWNKAFKFVPQRKLVRSLDLFSEF